MDTVTVACRSRMMAKIHSKNTLPELRVRRALHALGYRYRLHVSLLPGCPDMVFPQYRLAIQIRGCFWHGHSCARLPKSNQGYWHRKIAKNKLRDKKNDSALRRNGWRLLVVKECRIKTEAGLQREVDRIVRSLEKARKLKNSPSMKISSIIR